MTTSKEHKNGRVFSYVRWSSDQQTLGDSERRQLEAAQNYAEHNGLALSTEQYQDPGVSAWHGDHRKSGKLGALLKRVKEGDTITIESYSRWSREHPLDGLNALRETTDRGVSVHFTSGGMIISRDNFKSLFAMLSLHAQLSNAENEERSYKIKAAYENRRQKIKAGQITFGRLPAWLKWNYPARPRRDDRAVVEIPEKVAQVRKIFALCLDGHGCHGIERIMRDEPALANSERAEWNTRFIHRLLTDRAVMGFHPSGKVPVFPAIIDQQTFERAAAKLQDRKNYNVAFSRENNSLFTTLLFCARCGRTVIRQTAARAYGKSYKYLQCRGGIRQERGCDCGCVGMRYDKFEEAFAFMLTHTERVRDALTEGYSGPSKVDQMRDQLKAVQDKANDLLMMLKKDKPSQRVMDLISDLEAEEKCLQNKLDVEESKEKSRTPTMESYKELTKLDLTNKEHRRKMRVLIKELVSRIDLQLGKNRFEVTFRSGKKISVSFGGAGTWFFLE